MNLNNKLCIVTGANSGIGKETVRAFAQQGAYVVMVCRNEQRAHQAKEELVAHTGHAGIEVMLADLAIQHDVRQLADKISNKFEKADILVNNAGIIADEREETLDGIEKTLAVNHLAPFLLTNLLLNHLKKSEDARVVNVSSEVHRLGAKSFDINDLQLRTGYSAMRAYGVSKLCNIMFTHELAKRTQGSNITTNSLHPGVVRTQLAEEANWMMKLFYWIGSPFMRSPQSGAETSIYLATADEIQEQNGQYFRNKKVATPASIAFDDELTERLWQLSADLTHLS